MNKSAGSKETIVWPEAENFLISHELDALESKIIARFTGNRDKPHSTLGRISNFVGECHTKVNNGEAPIADEPFFLYDLPFKFSLAVGEERILGSRKKEIIRGVLDNIYDYYEVDRIHTVQDEVLTNEGTIKSYVLYANPGSIVFAEKGLWYDSEGRDWEPDEIALSIYFSYGGEEIIYAVANEVEDSWFEELTV